MLELADGLASQGLTHFAAQEYEQAIAAFTEAVKILSAHLHDPATSSKLEMWEHLILYHSWLAQIFDLIDNTALCEHHAEKVIQLTNHHFPIPIRKKEQWRVFGTSYGYLGTISQKNGSLEDATQYNNEAINILENKITEKGAEEWRLLSTMHSNLGYVFHKKKDTDLAIKAFNIALNYWLKLPADTSNNILSIYTIYKGLAWVTSELTLKGRLYRFAKDVFNKESSPANIIDFQIILREIADKKLEKRNRLKIIALNFLMIVKSELNKVNFPESDFKKYVQMPGNLEKTLAQVANISSSEALSQLIGGGDSFVMGATHKILRLTAQQTTLQRRVTELRRGNNRLKNKVSRLEQATAAPYRSLFGKRARISAMQKPVTSKTITPDFDSLNSEASSEPDKHTLSPLPQLIL